MLPRLEYIKQARVRLGITQRKLATLTGISTSMINQIESEDANRAMKLHARSLKS